MKLIHLKNSTNQAKVDDKNYEAVMEFEWFEDKDGYCKTQLSDGRLLEMGAYVMWLSAMKNN